MVKVLKSNTFRVKNDDILILHILDQILKGIVAFSPFKVTVNVNSSASRPPSSVE